MTNLSGVTLPHGFQGTAQGAARVPAGRNCRTSGRS